jgi:hypothetical protein
MISAIEMALGGMIYEPRFIKIGTEVQAILMVLLQQTERLQCWYTWRGGLLPPAVGMTSGDTTQISRFMKIDSGIQVALNLLPQRFYGLQWC